jgi:PAS domain S-box-containing protein
VMAVQSYEQGHLYGESELAIFSTIAAQVAVAIRNASLYLQIVSFSSELEEKVEARTRDLGQALQDLTTQRDRAETLYRITSELGATLDLDQVLRHALDLFADALQVEHGTITLLDPESGYLELRAVLGPGQERAKRRERTSLAQGVGLAGWTLVHRKPALVPDVTKDERWSEIDGRELSVRSVVAAPLSLGGGDNMGVLTLGHSAAGYFTEDHLQLVTAAASQIAIAVNNSDLYAYITEQADQLGTMLQSQESEAAKNRAILESIADGVLVLDHNGRVLLVNPAAEELLGLSAMVIEGEHFRHILGLGETAAQRDLAQALYHELRTRLETIDDDRARLQAGSVRLESGKQVLAVNMAPLIVTVGGAPGLVAALRDASREAEVERLKNEFISTVSHELRTPMTSIKGYTDLLFLGMVGGLTDAQRNFLQIIKSNADRLTALVNDILDISRIETGRIRLTIEPLDLNSIISEVVIAFQEQYRDKGLALEWEEVTGLPKIRGDAARVTQVLNNLIANSWQYTPSGGQVAVSVHSRGGFLQVDVTDTGIGIGPDDIGRVFDRFYRVDDPAVEEVGGTGLGLSIVKMFVELLGGEIWIESELGVGTTFSFTVPLTTADVPEVSLDLLETAAPVVGTRRQKILVVEENHDLALLLRKQLESEGYQVLLAGSGEDAIWLAREEKPQLITLDIMLPDLDGFTVLERLKEHPVTAPIPVVIVSILSDEEKGYALGAVDYVVKPFREDKLLRSLRAALSPLEEGTPRSVLVVDDDADIRGFLEQALSYHGYNVRTAANGQGALEQIKVELPDLILLDLKMPGVDGYEVIRRLKAEQDTRAIPVVVITASTVDKERDKVRVLGMGATQYFTKPFSIKSLIDEIKRVVVERPSP